MKSDKTWLKEIYDDIIESSLIENKIFDRLINLLNEDRGVSDTINDLIERLEIRIVNSIEIDNNHEYDNGVYSKQGNFEIWFCGEKIIINWEYYDFENEYYYNVYSNIKNNATIEYVDNENDKHAEVKFILKAICGKIDYARSFEGLQHEFQHFWERHNNPNGKLTDNLYNFSQFLMDNNPKETYKWHIGNIIYLSKKYEQRAYSNGAYRYLMNCENPLLTRKNVRNTQLYLAIMNLASSVNAIQKAKNWMTITSIKETIDELYTNYKIGYKELIEIGYESIDKMIKELGRTLSKSEDDLRKKYNFKQDYSQISGVLPKDGIF